MPRKYCTLCKTSYFRGSVELNVYGYKHNQRELRKKKWEGVLGVSSAECVRPYIYTVLT